METNEIAVLIQELEDRVERLRALYEQYFMGIERIEPLILRKDVDRRLWLLRREQIRNTGTRFKLQTTIQRYNTYQQYWQRICRDIENGTYQRDLGRAAQRFGAAATATTALGRRRQKMFEKGQAKRAEREATRAGSAESIAPPASPSSAPPEAPAPPPPSEETLDLELDTDDPPSEVVPTQVSPRLEPPRPGAKLPALAPKPPLPPLRIGSPATAPRPAGGAPPVPAARPAPPAPPRPGAAPAVIHAPAPAAKPAPVPIVATPAPVAAAKPPSPAPGPAKPATPTAVQAAKPAPAAVATSGDDSLSDTRLRQIYGRYVEAKRQCKESTANTTFDKVAETLRRSEQQLRAQHRGRRIDFDVVVKDGKPILKPVVKG